MATSATTLAACAPSFAALGPATCSAGRSDAVVLVRSFAPLPLQKVQLRSTNTLYSSLSGASSRTGRRSAVRTSCSCALPEELLNNCDGKERASEQLSSPDMLRWALAAMAVGRAVGQVAGNVIGAAGLSLLGPLLVARANVLAQLSAQSVAMGLGSLCLAAVRQPAPVSTPLTVVASGMAKWLELYSGVLLVRVLLSWFPNIDWERQPLQAMRDMCDPYLNLFRNILPPFFGALDLSPMLAFLVLGLLSSILNTTMYA